MTSNLLSALAMSLMVGVGSVGFVQADAHPKKQVNVSNLLTFTSEYLDEQVSGLCNLDCDIEPSRLWDNFGRTYGFNAENYTFDLYDESAYDSDSLAYINGYQFLISLWVDDDDTGDLIIRTYYYDDIYNIGDNSYQCDYLATIFEVNTYPSAQITGNLLNYSVSTTTNDAEFWSWITVPHANGSVQNYPPVQSYYLKVQTIRFHFTDITYQQIEQLTFRCHLEMIVDTSDQSQYALGYRTGYYDGYDEGLTDGYNQGYRVALDELSENRSFMSLFNAIADTPLRFIYGLFNFNLFGTSVLMIVLSLLTATIIFALVKKLWK